jgi:hypothetical protein
VRSTGRHEAGSRPVRGARMRCSRTWTRRRARTRRRLGPCCGLPACRRPG